MLRWAGGSTVHLDQPNLPALRDGPVRPVCPLAGVILLIVSEAGAPIIRHAQ